MQLSVIGCRFEDWVYRLWLIDEVEGGGGVTTGRNASES